MEGLIHVRKHTHLGPTVLDLSPQAPTMAKLLHLLDRCLEDMSMRYPKCPECNVALVARTGKYGGFLGCPGFPVCDHTENHTDATRDQVLKDIDKRFGGQMSLSPKFRKTRRGRRRGRGKLART